MGSRRCVDLYDVVIKINNDAEAVETAIANLDWETALELDSYNAAGLRVQPLQNRLQRNNLNF